MKKWVVYILELNDGSYYTGITVDINNRLKEHTQGKGSKYVRSRLPIKRIVFQSEALSSTDARKEEARIKRMTRKQKEQFIKESS